GEASQFLCNLGALSPDERRVHQTLARAVFAACEERRELEDGFAFRIARRIELAEIARWVSLERKCCPFFEFELHIGSNDGPNWLRITGAPGVKDFLRTEIGA